MNPPSSIFLSDLIDSEKYHSIIVPCPCVGCDPFPAKPDYVICDGTGRISYGIEDVEVA